MKVDYRCKFCGVPGSVEVEDNAATLVTIEKWSKVICCDRCNDFKLACRKVTDGAKKGCVSLIQSRMANVSKLHELESALKSKMLRLTQSFTDICCNHYRTKFDFNPDFADEIMAQPDKWQSVFIVLESAIRRSAHARQYVLHESKTPYVD